MPVSPCKKNDFVYWKKLSDTCFNKEVGHAFYCLMLERDTAKFNSQDFPHSDIKDEINIDRLNNIYKFVKFEYIYKKKDMKISVKDLYEQYLEYCKDTQVDFKFVAKKSVMLAKLREVEINYKSSHSTTVYRKSYVDLMEIARKWNWLSVHDNDEIKDKPASKVDEVDEDDEDGEDDKDDTLLRRAHKKNEELKEENIRLKQEIENLKKLINPEHVLEKTTKKTEKPLDKVVNSQEVKKTVKTGSQYKAIEDKTYERILIDMF
jgi:hypothetical protein